MRRSALLLSALLAGLVPSGGCAYEVWLGQPWPAGDATPEPDATIPPVEPGPAPCLFVEPWVVDFGVVADGALATHMVSVETDCADLGRPIEVTGFTLSGNPGFTVEVPGRGVWALSTGTALDGVVLDPPLLVSPGAAAQLEARFTPSAAAGAHANLVIQSDDPAVGQGLAVKLRANTALPCVATYPKTVDFGSALVGAEPDEVTLTVKSCGAVPLEVAEVALDGPTSFEADLPAGAVSIEPGESLLWTLRYAPLEVAPTGSDNLPVREQGALTLVTNAYWAEHVVTLRGFGVDQACPEATIHPDLPSEVVPPMVLTLDGSGSQGSAAPVTAWQWTVQGPPGAATFPFVPSASAPAPEFEVAIAGDHLFRLMVWDADGTPACGPAEWAVRAAPGPGLYVELVWDTPGDPDRYDRGPDAGTDLDLHLLHPFAHGVGQDLDGDGEPDGWFDVPFDACWFNPEPDWGEHGDPKALDDPVLARDDLDGVGPETIRLPEMEGDAIYTVGVHYWDDHGLGESLARVRIWLDGELRFDSEPAAMIDGWLWRVATVDASTGVVSAVTDGGACAPCLRKAPAAQVPPKL